MGDVVQLIKDMGAAKIMAFAGIILVFVLGFFVLSNKMTAGSYSPLYNGLDPADGGQIISELEARKIPYDIAANGTQILVPHDQVLKLRLELATQGLPAKGSLVGYEIFDKSEALGTSNFVQNVNLLRALEGELARTIGSFHTVDSARVHLVVPKRELFARDKQDPTASIIIKMKGSNKLSKDEIKAISHLVATAVPGLDVNRITVVDNYGRSLKLGVPTSEDQNGFASNSDEYKVNFENRMRSNIEDILSRSLGDGKVRANVSAEINFDRIVTNSEIYDPDGQVIRSVQTHEENEKSGSALSKDSSVANNLPGGEESEGGGSGGQDNRKTDEITNYEITKTIKNQISETGTVKRLSVAVLVDGYYKPNEQGETEYVPRTDEELKKIETLVKSAVGFDDVRKDKIEVVNMQFITDMDVFKQETTKDWFKRELPSIIQSVVIGIVVILVLLFIVRPLAIRAFEIHKYEDEEISVDDKEIQEKVSAAIKEQAEADLKSTMEEEDKGLDIDILGKKFKSSSVKTINDFAGKYPEETVSIIRSWLSKD